MKSIEQRIYEKVMTDMSESMKYNQSISANLASAIEGMNFKYKASVVTPSGNKDIPVYVNMILNEDDIETVESDNVVYTYLKASNLDFKLELDKSNPEILDSNPHELIRIINNANSCIVTNPNFSSISSWIITNSKCWKDNDNLYLLKMNKNTGIVSRYDSRTNTFRRQDSINYLNALDSDIAKTLLTVDYLKDYLSSQLYLIRSSLDYKEEQDVINKIESEKLHICRTN